MCPFAGLCEYSACSFTFEGTYSWQLYGLQRNRSKYSMFHELANDFRPAKQRFPHDFDRVFLSFLLQQRQRIVERPVRKQNQREGAESQSTLGHADDGCVSLAGKCEKWDVEQTTHRIGLGKEGIEEQSDVESRFEAAFASTEQQIQMENFVDDSGISSEVEVYLFSSSE